MEYGSTTKTCKDCGEQWNYSHRCLVTRIQHVSPDGK